MNMNNLELEYMRNLHNLEKRKTSISSSSFQSLEIPAHLSHFLFRTNMFSTPVHTNLSSYLMKEIFSEIR